MSRGRGARRARGDEDGARDRGRGDGVVAQPRRRGRRHRQRGSAARGPRARRRQAPTAAAPSRRGRPTDAATTWRRSEPPRPDARRRPPRRRRQAPRAGPPHRPREPRRPHRRRQLRRVRTADVRRPGAPAPARGADRAHAGGRPRRRAPRRSTARRRSSCPTTTRCSPARRGCATTRRRTGCSRSPSAGALPVVLFAEGGGGRPGDVDWPHVAGLDCRAFHLFARLSGLVPLIGIASGYCFAGNAALLGCCDVVIATEDSSIGMGGPAMIEGGGLGVFDPQEVGPIDVQDANGVVDLRVADERRRGRGRQALPRVLPRRRSRDGAAARPGRAARPHPRQPQAHLRHPHGHRRAARRACSSCAAGFGAGIVTALARVDGQAARRDRQQPDAPRRRDRRRRRRQGGALHAAVRRVRAADAVPLRHARLHGRARRPRRPRPCATSRACSSPAPTSNVRRTIVLRKGYGLGAQAMAGGSFKAPLSRSRGRPPSSAAMGLEGAVRLGMRRELEAIADPAERKRAYEQAVAAAYEQRQGPQHGRVLRDRRRDRSRRQRGAGSRRCSTTRRPGAAHASAGPTSTPGSAFSRSLRTGWRTRAGVTTRIRRRSPAAGFGESVRKRRGALSSRPQPMPRLVRFP